MFTDWYGIQLQQILANNFVTFVIVQYIVKIYIICISRSVIVENLIE